jgi:ESCRT-II complex subunit VPS22
MHRRPGVQGVQAAAAAREAYRALGDTAAEAKAASAAALAVNFRAALERFAAAHAGEVAKDPALRAAVHAMCARLGVDPLLSNRRGSWAARLGLGDFYAALAVAALDVCAARRPLDGGLTDLETVHRHVVRRRGGAAEPVTLDDVARAVEGLGALGAGLGVVRAGGRRLVRSVPAELSPDGGVLLALAAAAGGFFAASDARASLGWAPERAADALGALLRDGMLLADDPPRGGERLFWCPALGVEAAAEEYRRREGLL